MRILLVDDNDTVRRVLAGILRCAGQAVAEAATASEAVARVTAAGRLDLLIVDLELPGLGGWEVVEQARAARPRLRVGVIGRDDRRPPVAVDFALPRPFSLLAFRRAVDGLGAVSRVAASTS